MRRGLLHLLLSLLALSAPQVRADSQAHQSAPQQAVPKAGPGQAWSDAQAVAHKGPQDIALAGQAVMHLPEGQVFIPQPQAASLLRAMGNPGDYADLQGLVLSQQQGSDWFVIVSYEASGHISDDDAKDWNTDAMLKLARASTQAANIEREKTGVPALVISGWAQRPSYTPATHRLLWALVSRSRGGRAGAPEGINENACVLGREGYLSLNLVTDLSQLPATQPEVEGLLAAIAFLPGKRYADFNPSTDHIAKDGLAALVQGASDPQPSPLARELKIIAPVLLVLLVWLGWVIAKSRKREKFEAPAPLLLPAPEPAEPNEPPGR